MPKTIQKYAAGLVSQCAVELKDVFLKVPVEKRDWKPADTARSALDQIAEVAVISARNTETIVSHASPSAEKYARFAEDKEEAKADVDALLVLFDTNVSVLIAAIEAIPESDLAIQVTFPWGSMSLEEIMTYPSWNMSYHEGQINYILSLLDSP